MSGSSRNVERSPGLLRRSKLDNTPEAFASGVDIGRRIIGCGDAKLRLNESGRIICHANLFFVLNGFLKFRLYSVAP